MHGQLIAFNRFNATITEFLVEYAFAGLNALLLMEETTGSARALMVGGALCLKNCDCFARVASRGCYSWTSKNHY